MPQEFGPYKRKIHTYTPLPVAIKVKCKEELTYGLLCHAEYLVDAAFRLRKCNDDSKPCGRSRRQLSVIFL